MSDSLAPRTAERLLEAIGADTEFRDSVIGDLAKEFGINAATMIGGTITGGVLRILRSVRAPARVGTRTGEWSV
jgi:hypothetical protein